MSRKLALGSIGLLLLASPFFASAQTVAELQARLQVLLAQIAALQAATHSTSAPPSYAACPHIIRTLAYGVVGEDVTELQQFLTSQGHLAAGNSGGSFNKLTEAAVQRFQCQHNIACSGSPSVNGYGVVGPRTRTAIASLCGTTTLLPTASLCRIDGITLASGETRNFFSSSQVSYGQSCSQFVQSRTCSNGYLSGDTRYGFSTCSSAGASRCDVGDGTTVRHGESVLLYSAAFSQSGSTCASMSRTRTCTNGTLSGSSNYNRRSCVDVPTGACVAEGVVIPNGNTRTFYTREQAPVGQLCTAYSQTKTCTNGSLSGDASYSKTACTDGSAPSGTVTLNKSSYNPGETASVSWSVTAVGTKDWIAIAPMNGNWQSGSLWAYTGDTTNGTKGLELPATIQTGTYQFVYYRNNAQNEVARSASFTVAPKAQSISVSANASSFISGASVTATWSNSAGALVDDWIAMIPVGGIWRGGETATPQTSWVWVTSNTQTQGSAGAKTGSISIPANVAPGQYQLVYYIIQKDAGGNYIEKVRSDAFAITASVVLKINGSDGPLTVPPGTAITATIDSQGTVQCNLTNLAGVNQAVYPYQLGTIQQTTTYTATCTTAGGGSVTDSVTVNVSGASIAPTATIDASALTTTSGSPSITGSATNATTLRVTISPQGATAPLYYDNTSVTVTNGHWSVYGSVPSVGQYTVRVYSGTTLLTSGTLVVNASGGGA